MKIKLIDLSQEIYNGMPVYQGHQRTVVYKVRTHEECRELYEKSNPNLKNMPVHTSITMGLLMSDHGPTHTDSHSHLDPSPEAESIEKIPLEKFYTPGVVINVSNFHTEPYITKNILEQVCNKDKIIITENSTALIYTGHYDRNYNTIDWLYNYPGLDGEATEWLADKGVINIGIDAPSIDSSVEFKRRVYPAHRACKKRKILNTENLCNLDKVLGKEFTYCGFPLKIRGGSGGPIRAVAIIYQK